MLTKITAICLSTLILAVILCTIYEKRIKDPDRATIGLITLLSLIVVLIAFWVIPKIKRTKS